MKTLLALLALTTLVSCGNDSGGRSTVPVDIIGSTYHLDVGSEFSTMTASVSRELGQSLTITISDFVLAEGVTTMCTVSGMVTLSDTYYTFFDASLVASGDTSSDAACSNAFSGGSYIEAGDSFMKYSTPQVTYKLTL